MQIVILAAGRGTRLAPITDKIPKCLVEIKGKPILQHQLDVYNDLNLMNVTVIGGYKAEKILKVHKKVIINKDFASTNMVATLFTLPESVWENTKEDLIVSYGDIVFEVGVLKELLKEESNISIVADLNWEEYWASRMEEPLKDAETFKFIDKKVKELGKKPLSINDIEAQYIGLFKISKNNLKGFKNNWEKYKKIKADPLNCYMTDFLQFNIDSGVDIKPVLIKNGWLEIDTPSDLAIEYEKFWNAYK